jgi:hypothetical protein
VGDRAGSRDDVGWTNGDAEPPDLAAPAILEVTVGETVPYPVVGAGDNGARVSPTA